MIGFIALAAAAAAAAASLSPFEGQWHCEGRFISSGKLIRSELAMALDRETGVLVVYHDDAAPMVYHSIETWTADPNAVSFYSAVSDRYNGLRVFRSAGFGDGSLTFSRSENGAVQEEFRYTLESADVLQIDWSVARTGQTLRLGDTLTCNRRT